VILALITVESGPLTGCQLDQMLELVLEDRDGTAWNRQADLDVVLRQSFLLGDCTVGPRDRPLGSGQFEKEIEQQVSAKMKREAGEVGDKPAIVAVDDQAGEAVPSLRTSRYTAPSLPSPRSCSRNRTAESSFLRQKVWSSDSGSHR
jgi:hypothetical protein